MRRYVLIVFLFREKIWIRWDVWHWTYSLVIFWWQQIGIKCWEGRCSLLNVSLVIELPATFYFSVESLDMISENRAANNIRREWPHIRSSDDASLLI